MKFTQVALNFVFFILISCFSLAQNKIDSLQQVLKSIKEKESAATHNFLAREFFNTGDINSCYEHAEKALEISEKHGNALEEVVALNMLAIVYSAANQLDDAIKYGNKGLAAAKKLGNTIEEANALNLIGIVYYQRGAYDEALSINKKALELRKEAGDKMGVSKSLSNIGQIHANKAEFELAMGYYEQALELRKELNDQRGMANLYYSISSIYIHLDKSDQAIEANQPAQKIFEHLNDKRGAASCINQNGLIYENMKNFEKAFESYFEALTIFQEIDYKTGIADVYNNIGNVYTKADSFAQAIEYYNKSIEVRKEIGDRAGLAKSLQTLGLAYIYWGKHGDAVGFFEEAMAINDSLNIRNEYAANLYSLGLCYMEFKEYDKALDNFNKSLQIAKKNDLKNQIKYIYESISRLYKELGQYDKALMYYEQYSMIKDSLLNEKLFKQITELQTKYETEKKESQIKLQKSEIAKKEAENKRQRFVIYAAIAGLSLILLLAVQIFVSLQRKKRDNKIIAEEKEKSEKLLLNTLPVAVVQELKDSGKSEPVGFDNVTVYFSDVVGFTNMSSALDPQKLIGELNDIFTAFDDIMYSNKCERIKTIGDAYMAVSGMPIPDPDHAENMLKSSIKIMQYLNRRNSENELQWRIRIGIHSGKVVGGIVGVRKYLYDVFGDTINTASRMESNSEPMRINVSELSYHLLKDKYSFVPRQALEVKGKGIMNMYFLDNSHVLS
jgi:adenylate cyclase